MKSLCCMADEGSVVRLKRLPSRRYRRQCHLPGGSCTEREVLLRLGRCNRGLEQGHSPGTQMDQKQGIRPQHGQAGRCGIPQGSRAAIFNQAGPQYITTNYIKCLGKINKREISVLFPALILQESGNVDHVRSASALRNPH